MADLMCLLSNLLFFGIPLLYYISLNSIIFCLSFGEIYLSLGISLLTSFCNFFDALVILSAILLPIKSPVASAVFWIAFFEAVFIASVADF